MKYLLIYISTLNNNHDLWVVTDILWIQVAKMSFLCRLAGLTHREVGWFRYLIWMPPGCHSGEVFVAYPTGWRRGGRLGQHRRVYVSNLVLVRLGIDKEELEDLVGERDIWTALHKHRKMNGWFDERILDYCGTLLT